MCIDCTLFSGRHAAEGIQSIGETAVVSSEQVILVTPQPAALVRRLSDSDHAGEGAAPVWGCCLQCLLWNGLPPCHGFPSSPLVPQSLSYGLLGVAALAVLAVSALVFAAMRRSRPRVEAIKL